MFNKLRDYLSKIVWIMTKSQRALGGVLLLLVLFGAFVQLLSVYAIAPLVSVMTNGDVFMTTRIASVLSWFLDTDDFRVLLFALCVCIAVLYFLKELLALFQTWFSIKYSQKVQRELSQEVFTSYMEREYDFFLNYGTAKVLRDVNEDTIAVYTVLLGYINVFNELITSFFLLIYVVVSDYEMAICMAGLAIVSLFLLAYGLKRKLMKKGEEARIRNAEKQKILLEAVEGIKEVQVMKKQDAFVASFVDSLTKAQKPLTFQTMAVTAPTSIIEGIFVIGIVLYMGVKALVDTTFMGKLPLLATFLAAAIRMLPSMGRITNNINNIQFYVPALNTVYNNIKLIREKKYNSNNYKLIDSGRNIEFFRVLELRGVSYHYQDSDKNVLDNLNMSIHKGESIGIIGQSGAGKSTLADLILGLHIPQEGSVQLDGTDIKKIPYEYSRVIGYVPQNVYLVDGTIRENVAFGVNPDEINDDDVIDALKKAKLYEFIMNTEEGLDTIVGERGVKFSGGQRQRVAIARALYRKPQILVLDEATSALDNETEFEVMQQVEEMQGSITLVIIAHRLSTIEKCDCVYELIDGKAIRREGEF